MNPNQNVVSSVAPSPAAPAAPSQVEAPEEKKKGKGMILGMVLLLILALGGIGFGVWAFMDGNAQKDSLNAQINDLKAQNSDLLDQVASLNETIDSYKLNDDVDGSDNENLQYDEIIVDGVFYIKDKEGNILAQSSIGNVTEIVSCDYFDEASILKCAVATSDGDGWFLYNFSEELLTSSFDNN